MCTFWYIHMSDVAASYGTFLDFIALFWVFWYIINEYSCLKYCIFTKHSQIDVHILEYHYAQCNYRLWQILWFYCVPSLILIYYMSETLQLHQTLTNCVFRKNWKEFFVTIYGYISLVLNVATLFSVICGKTIQL